MNLSFKNVRLYLKLKDQIYGGRYDDCALPPERELVSRLGISRNTVRFALRLLELEGLIRRSRGKGTSTVHAPRRKEPLRFLFCEKANCSSATHVFSQITAGIHAEALQIGREIDICPLQEFTSMEPEELQMLFRRRGIAGVILPLSQFNGKEKICALLEALDVPVVLVYCSESDSAVTGYAAVVRSLRPAWRAALAYLVESGHRRIVTLTLPQECVRDVFSNEEYENMLKALGLAVKMSPVIRCNPVYEELKEKLQKLFEDPQRKPDAVLCYSDFWAPAVYRVLNALHQRIPEDVSVMGYCGNLNPDFIAPQLSSVEIEYEEIGHLAVRILNDAAVWYKQPAVKPPVILAPYMLKVRASTRRRPCFGEKMPSGK